VKRAGIDVDGVVADLHTPWLRRISEKLGRDIILPEDMNEWKFWDTFGFPESLAWEVYTPDIYDEVEPYPGVRHALADIQTAGHMVAFVTQSKDLEMFNAKREWLYRYGLVMGNTEIHPVGRWADMKTKGDRRLRLDMLVDDNVDNLDESGVYGILVTQPHNRRLIAPYRRVKNLTEVATLLKYQDQGRGEETALDAVMESYNYGAEHCALVASPQRSSCVIGGSPMVTILPSEPAAIVEKAKTTSPLPSDPVERKAVPMMTGLLDYFPAALAEVAKISVAGNKQHFVNEPLHWDRTKSADHVDSAVRHLMDRGKFDTDGRRHSAKAAWRALANLQEELEGDGVAPPSRASTF
jgi:Uncharacterized protein conserved in bacteria